MLLSGPIEDVLKSLGERLRDARLQRNETQQMFAARIGISVPTLSKLENGDHRVQLGHWVSVLDVLGRVRDLDCLLAPKENLFDKYERAQQNKRQRASRKSDQ